MAMWKLRSIFNLLILCSAVTLVAAQGSTNSTSKWQTLSGDAPLVIAHGGFSGLFPSSSFNAYSFAAATSLTNVIMWCDVQLTKDGVGICFPDINLHNATNIDALFKDKGNTYLVNGVSTKGWFPIDFNFKDLALVNLQQGIYSRSNRFDGTPQQILTVQDLFNQLKPPGLWLNVQHDSFYTQHNLSMRSFVLTVSRRVVINYISSPEVNFLKSIAARINPTVTKLVFRFLGNDETEPSTNQTYGSLLQNLASIKTFASGILVPKSYIWPVDKSSSYLQPHTSLVLDAHKVGLEVYASDFASDVPFAFDYSYDPVAEYLSFIDNGNFSVDGVVSDFPITPSEAIDCYSHMGKGAKNQVPELLVISFDGASGDYPGCTDKAYSKAVSDGVDIIDCTVQMTKDGIPFCMGSVNLIDGTTAAQQFSNLAVSIPELKTENAIHSFDLNWKDIQSLQAQISNPYAKFRLFRNPEAKNDGKFMTLEDFLTFASNATTSVSGVLISIENAAYLAEKKGLGVTDAVLGALDKANLTAKKVMIHSNDSSVLMKFTNSKYERVYGIKEEISDIQNSTILEIKKFASSVIIGKFSVFPTEDLFLVSVTNVVAKLQAFKVKVYVQLFSNEFVSQAWDFFSDPYVEINSFVYGASTNPLDGVITGFPATANRFRRNRCLGYKEIPPYMLPVAPGGLLPLMSSQYLPPAEAPNPVLTESDVVEPPLPPVAKIVPASNNNGSAPGPNASPSGQSSITASISMISLCILLAVLVIS